MSGINDRRSRARIQMRAEYGASQARYMTTKDPKVGAQTSDAAAASRAKNRRLAAIRRAVIAGKKQPGRP